MVLSRCRGCGRSLHTIALSAVVATLLLGCSVSQTFRQNSYTVQRGDTLYGIAQHFHMRWRNLATWNHIGPPYRLEVGQTLTLKPYPKLDYSKMPEHGRRRIVRAPQDSKAQQKHSIDVSVQQLDRTVESESESESESDSGSTSKQPAQASSSSAPPQTPSSGGQSAKHREQQQAETSEKVTQKADSESAQKPPAPDRIAGPGHSQWQWPVSGTIIKAYAPNKSRKGIEIGGAAGAPVYAASGGRVVYNGPGLKGFGQLIILKHPNDYLSAYGFVRDSRVKKGQSVKVGTRIASVGVGPGRTSMLHFEIRHDGDPINPESMLPKH